MLHQLVCPDDADPVTIAETSIQAAGPVFQTSKPILLRDLKCLLFEVYAEVCLRLKLYPTHLPPTHEPQMALR